MLGNFIGVDRTGTARLGNGMAGVLVQDASDTIIGGKVQGARNVISANEDGVRIESERVGPALTTGNVVAGNFIGTDSDGVAGLGNSRAGVLIEDASNNQVGGTAEVTQDFCKGECNLISDNGDGVVIASSAGSDPAGTSKNSVLGNFIGTDSAGVGRLGNLNASVDIQDASSNTIGGLTTAARNVIAANRIGVR